MTSLRTYLIPRLNQYGHLSPSGDMNRNINSNCNRYEGFYPYHKARLEIFLCMWVKWHHLFEWRKFNLSFLMIFQNRDLERDNKSLCSTLTLSLTTFLIHLPLNVVIRVVIIPSLFICTLCQHGHYRHQVSLFMWLISPKKCLLPVHNVDGAMIWRQLVPLLLSMWRNHFLIEFIIEAWHEASGYLRRDNHRK